MWLGQEEAQAALATLQGKGHKSTANLQRLLSEIVVVEVGKTCPWMGPGCLSHVFWQPHRTSDPWPA